MIGEYLAISALNVLDKEAMFGLLDRHFFAMRRDIFESDLLAKDGVVILREAGSLVGFSTYTLRASIDINGHSASVLCSGDTLIDPEHWGSSALGRTLIQSAWELHRQSGRETFWWLLITSGPRTWGVLPTFFKVFHPQPSRPNAVEMETWLRELCEQRWSGQRDPSTGLITLHNPQRLRPPLDTVPTSRLDNEGVRWFVMTNPGWQGGDELPSLVRIDSSNLTRAGWRYLSEYLDSHS